ncbi:MAG: hypothetical protein FJ125_07900, partial [Deltaproteobacteria bacterium]|nr:hypothetical protein [Deltaproteobacteria bacterium]
LREREDDIPLLLEEFLRDMHNPRFERGTRISMTPEALERVRRHSWPGNVRELKNVIERSVAMADSPLLKLPDLLLDDSAFRFAAAPHQPPTHPLAPVEEQAVIPLPVEDLDLPFKEAKQRVVDRFELQYLHALMQRHGGNISQGARSSGLTRFHLRELLKKHELSKGLEPGEGGEE